MVGHPPAHPRAIRLTLRVATSAVLLVGCTDAELFVRVTAASDVGEVDTLRVRVFRAGDTAPIQERAAELPSPLPHTFVVSTGGATRGEPVHLQVDGLREGAIVGMGDVLHTFPDGGRDELSVVLRSECAGLSCSRVRTCVVEDGTCSLTCAGSGGCADLVGCAAQTCALGGSAALGTCDGEAADEDEDNLVDERCPFGTERPDCDDTTAAVPSVELRRRCGGGRDHDCDGIQDERQTCASSCFEPTVRIVRHIGEDGTTTGFPVTAVGGVRTNDDGDRFYVVAGENIIATYTDGDRRVSFVEAEGVEDIFLLGPLAAAATARGLLLLDVRANGELRQIGAPIQLLPGAQTQGLRTVLLSEGTAWVSARPADAEGRPIGDGIGLAAIDVSRPHAPRLLGMQPGPTAYRLVRLSDGVLAAVANARLGALWFYPAEARHAPEAGASWATTRLGLSDDVLVAAVAAVPGRAGVSGEHETLAVAMRFTVGDDVRSQIALFDRSGDTVTRTDVVPEAPGVVALQLDAGALFFSNEEGSVGVIVRDPVNPGKLLQDLTDSADVGANGTTESQETLWATTNSTRDPRAVVGVGSRIQIYDFACAGGT